METNEKIYGIYFGIDCAPGAIRPDTFAKKVFEYLGLPYQEPDSMLMGAWNWRIWSEDYNKEYIEEFKHWMKQSMDKLYEDGYIRGAEWGPIDEEDYNMFQYLMSKVKAQLE